MIFDFNIQTNRNKDRINYILSYIHLKPYLYKSDTKDSRVNARLLMKIVGGAGYDDFKWLISNDYIINTGNYIKGVKSKSYILNYEKVQKKGIKKVFNNPYELKMKKMIQEGYDIDLDTNTKKILKETKNLFDKGIIKFDDENKVRSKINSFKKQSYDKYYSQIILFDNIINRDVTVNTDKRGSRIYTNYSNISKDIRRHIMIDNKYKVNIDIKNSQYQALCLYLNERFPELKKNKDVMNFYKLSHNGSIYDVLSTYLKMSRDDVKKYMFNWLYAENFVCKSKKIVKDIDELLMNMFPNVYKKIYEIKNKKDGGKKLSHILQNREANIIKKIQLDLFERGILNISLHDSISMKDNVNKDTINYVIRLLKNAGYEAIDVDYDRNFYTIKKRIEEKRLKEQFIKEVKGFCVFENKDKENIYYMITNKSDKKEDNNKKNIIKKEKVYDYGKIDEYLSKSKEELLNSIF